MSQKLATATNWQAKSKSNLHGMLLEPKANVTRTFWIIKKKTSRVVAVTGAVWKLELFVYLEIDCPSCSIDLYLAVMH